MAFASGGRLSMQGPLLLVVLLVVAASPHARACTSIIVGRGASDDGSLYITRSDDGEGARSPNNLIYHPARKGPAVFRANLNSLEVELPGPGLAYTALPVTPADPAAGRNASGEAAGVNSAGVAVSATESIYNSAAALAADPHNTETGIIEDAIPSVLLPQARSARQAVELLGGLVEERGAGEAFGVLMADTDPGEAWYLETASGHHWLAQRVPDDSVFVTANQGRFQEFDLSDTANVLASPGLERFAASAGLWDPASGQPLNFFQAFMREGPHDTNYSHPRICYMQHALAGVPEQPCGAEALARPAFLPAARPLGLEDVARVMRNHWDGSSHDPYARRNPDESWRPIALLRTGDAHIIRLRPTVAPGGGPPGVPPGLAVINYVALGMSSLCPFVPIYAGLPPKELPRELAGAAPLPDPAWRTLFWKARRLQALVMQDWPALGPQAEEVIRQFGQRMAQLPQKLMEARYMSALGLGDRAWATRELVAFTAAEVAQAGHTLDWLASQAAEALGLPGLPDADHLVQMLDEAAEAYAFEPTSDSDAAAAVAAAEQPGAGRITLPLRQDSSGGAAPQRQEQ